MVSKCGLRAEQESPEDALIAEGVDIHHSSSDQPRFTTTCLQAMMTKAIKWIGFQLVNDL